MEVTAAHPHELRALRELRALLLFLCLACYAVRLLYPLALSPFSLSRNTVTHNERGRVYFPSLLTT